jgi:hypothetical protein
MIAVIPTDMPQGACKQLRMLRTIEPVNLIEP